jgi:hypothetical protein
MAMSRKIGSQLMVTAVVAQLLALSGCGSDPTYPVIEVTPRPPEHTVITDPANPPTWTNFHSGEYVMFPIDLATAGVLDITVDWTFANSWIYVYFGSTHCEYSQLADHTCPFLISSETTTPKPRVLFTNPLQPGRYYLVFYNVPWDARTRTGSDNTETVVFMLGLMPSPAADGRTGTPARLALPVVLPPPARH